MCYFLTVAVAPEHVAALKRNVPRALRLAAQENRSISNQLRPFSTFTLSTNGCSCYLYTAPDIGDPPDPNVIEQKLRRKYVRKGWPAQKIARAVASAGSHRKPQEDFRGLRPDVRELLAKVVNEIGRLHVLMHEYSGDVDSEIVAARKGRIITTDDLRAGITEIGLDLLYTVARA